VSASGHQNPEQARLDELMAVNSAERAVADVRMADLAAAQTDAWRRHRASKRLVTRALKDGSAEKIAAEQERERQAYADASAIADAGIAEMFVINRAGLDRFGELLGQMGRAWDADAAALNEITGPEAGQ
jgi:hypothetical protein